MNVSLMKKSAEGYKKVGPYAAISVMKASTREDVIKEAIKCLADKDTRTSGDLILPCKGVVTDTSWTVGRYVSSLKKGEDHVPTVGISVFEGGVQKESNAVSYTVRPDTDATVPNFEIICLHVFTILEVYFGSK